MTDKPTSSFRQSPLGILTTPTITGSRVAIVQGGSIVGYRETVVVTQPSFLNQLAPLVLPYSSPDPTPRTTYTIDYDINGVRTSGTIRSESGFSNTPALPASCNTATLQSFQTTAHLVSPIRL